MVKLVLVGPGVCAAITLKSERLRLRHDAFLPAFGAPTPPSKDAVLAELDREFYRSLGPERAGTQCRREAVCTARFNSAFFAGPMTSRA